MLYNPMVLVCTRAAQIRENHKNKHAGGQSIATTAMNLAGGVIRIATTIKEVGWDFHILRAYGISVSLNAILGAQILVYRENTKKLAQKKKD